MSDFTDKQVVWVLERDDGRPFPAPVLGVISDPTPSLPGGVVAGHVRVELQQYADGCMIGKRMWLKPTALRAL